MVKIISILLLLMFTTSADTFENNCLECHVNEFKLNMFMKKYSLKYSSERAIKKAIISYLKEPSLKESVLPFGFLNRFGIKDTSDLEDKELQDMIDIYYKRYNISSRIK